MWRCRGVMGLALAAALLGGAAQAKLSAKHTKPAHLQGAACAAQFARDNAVKPEAGPYRMHLMETLLLNDGTASTREKLIEVVSQASRMRGVGTMDYVDIVMHGSQSWFKQSEAWVKLPSEQNPSTDTDGPETHHVNVAGAVRCLAPSTYQGQAVRSYVAQRTVREEGRQIVSRTRFLVGADTGLPVFSSFELSMGRKRGDPSSGGLMVVETRYEFDRSIQIPQPEALAP